MYTEFFRKLSCWYCIFYLANHRYTDPEGIRRCGKNILQRIKYAITSAGHLSFSRKYLYPLGLYHLFAILSHRISS